MGIDAALAIMGVSFVRAPTRLIFEHIKREYLYVLIESIQIVLKRSEVSQTIRYVVIFDALVLEVPIDLLNIHQILKGEVH